MSRLLFPLLNAILKGKEKGRRIIVKYWNDSLSGVYELNADINISNNGALVVLYSLFRFIPIS